jgi:ubiquinone biosynthesis protein
MTDRILERELGDHTGKKKERIIGRRLKEEFSHYKRYLQILNTVSKFGFSYLFDRVKSINAVPKLESTNERIKSSPAAKRLRLMFEDLGPTFIKIGQILTTQPNLVPEEYISEFENLKDDVDPISFDLVKTTVEKELGKTIESTFSSFQKTPIGSASIGQVHRAKTRDDRWVAVKIQKPGTKDQIMADLKILEDIAEMFGDLLGISEIMDPNDMVQEFKRLLTRELDYTIEARSIEHFQRDFKKIDEVIIPKIYWKFTTKRILTMDYIEGIPANDLNHLKKAGIDTKMTAKNIGQAIARMIFVKGYFHGDPHGGNVFIQKDGKIAFLDFGSIGYLDGHMRDRIRLFYLSIAREDVTRAAEIFLDICQANEARLNRPALEQDLREFLDFQELHRKGYKISSGMNQKLVSIALKHGFAPPTQFILLERSLLETEGVCRQLSPSFDLNQMLMPILGEVVKDKISSATDPIGAIQTAQDYRILMQKGPKRVYSILKKLDNGTLSVKMDTELVDEIRKDMWRIVLIMGVSLIAMSLIFMITVAGMSFDTPIFGMSLSTMPVIAVWLISIWWIYRRWHGPRS